MFLNWRCGKKDYSEGLKWIEGILLFPQLSVQLWVGGASLTEGKEEL